MHHSYYTCISSGLEYIQVLQRVKWKMIPMYDGVKIKYKILTFIKSLENIKLTNKTTKIR